MVPAVAVNLPAVARNSNRFFMKHCESVAVEKNTTHGGYQLSLTFMDDSGSSGQIIAEDIRKRLAHVNISGHKIQVGCHVNPEAMEDVRITIAASNILGVSDTINIASALQAAHVIDAQQQHAVVSRLKIIQKSTGVRFL